MNKIGFGRTRRAPDVVSTSEAGTIQEAPAVFKGTYISDAAVEDPNDDKFDRKAFAKRIAETVSSKIDPSSMVIGIHGPWGDGKTTVLNFVEKSLREYESVISFKFNPWRFEDESVLLHSFFESLARLLKRRLSNNKEEMGKLLVRYGELLSSGMRVIQTTAGEAMPGPLLGDLGAAATNLGALWSGTPLDELRLRIDTILRAERKRIVVMMDDIDRLDKAEIHSVLRLVKLTADFKYTTYILAFDNDMVAAAIGERYSGDPDRTFSAGADFLEKIIQVPLHLPPIPESALVSFCYECVDETLAESRVELTTDEVRTFTTRFQRAATGRLKTPRVAKRYANALAFSLAMLKGEVHLGELMLIEAVRLFYPELYVAIRKNKDLVLGIGDFARGMLSGGEVKQSITALITENTKKLNNGEREQAKGLLNALFPRTGDTIYGTEWEAQWSREKRITSREYFDRYFTYSIASTDVSDASIQTFVENAATLSRTQAVGQLRSLITPKNPGTVIAKLRQFEETILPEQASVLAQAVADVAESLPNPEVLEEFTTPFSQAAIFVSNVLKKIPDDQQRRIVCSVIVSESPSLRFACEFMRWSLADDKGQNGVLSHDGELLLKNQLVDRITAHLGKVAEPIYLAEPKNALTYLQFLESLGGSDQCHLYLEKTLAAHPETVFDFLRSTSSRAWNLRTGFPLEPEFHRGQYSLLSRLMDVKIVADILRAKFGSALDEPDISSSRGSDKNKIFAHQFMVAHNAALQKQKVAISNPNSSNEPDTKA